MRWRLARLCLALALLVALGALVDACAGATATRVLGLGLLAQALWMAAVALAWPVGEGGRDDDGG